MKKLISLLASLMLVFVAFSACSGSVDDTSSLSPLTQEEAAELLIQSYHDHLDDTDLHCVEPDVEFVGEKTVKDHECYLFYLFDLTVGSDYGLTHLLVDKNTSEVFVAGISGDDLVPINQYH